MFCKKHLEVFQGIGLVKQGKVGHRPSEWYAWIRDDWIKSRPHDLALELLELSSCRVSRKDIAVMVSNGSSTMECCASILAWGGMNRSDGMLLWKTHHKWLPVADEIRRNGLSRENAYKAFQALRSQGQLKGMGPAYFTKLIQFLMPVRPMRGYIMDQWTARSINLLISPEPLVILEKQKPNRFTVSDKNSSSIYEEFCCVIEKLSLEPTVADILEKASIKNDDRPEAVEMMLFSEGRRKGKWRNYVLDNPIT